MRYLLLTALGSVSAFLLPAPFSSYALLRFSSSPVQPRFQTSRRVAYVEHRLSMVDGATDSGRRKEALGSRIWRLLRRRGRGSASGKQPDIQVAVVGAGIAGLICARMLSQAGFDVRVFEASDGVGGRIRTDVVDGFLLDRGFQVFIEEYPDVKRQLDYEALRLRPFAPGALVRCEGGLHLVADPLRRPGDIFRALTAPVGDIVDKVKIGIYRLSAGSTSLESVFASPETDTRSFLKDQLGLSTTFIDRFFVPFYRGIFLAPLEEQSSRMFQFVFKMFADGDASLPEGGMGAITEQVAQSLPAGTIRLNSPVQRIIPIPASGGTGFPILQLPDGTSLTCGAAVVATEAPAAARLLAGGASGGKDNKDVAAASAAAVAAVAALPGRSSICLYYALPSPPLVIEPLLVLNGEGTDFDNPANNVAFLDAVAPTYAPEGFSLASVTVVGGTREEGAGDGDGDDLEARVRKQMARWFGAQKVASWRHLRTYKVPYAQPPQTVGQGSGTADKPVVVGGGVFVCGDHRSSATLNGAVKSGVRAAEAVAAALAAEPLALGVSVSR